MPNTPKVMFNFTNNNVQQTTPTLGVSFVLARTTKGPFNQPDTIFNSYAAFQRVYGEEIVPDGTISNIKKAFELGSMLRVSRVSGNPSLVEYGKAFIPESFATPDEGEPEELDLAIVLVDPSDSSNTIETHLGIRTREAGSPIVSQDGNNKNFFLKIHKTESSTAQYFISQYKYASVGDSEVVTLSELISQNLFFSGAIYSTSGQKGDNPFVDAQSFKDFVNNAPNIEFTFKSSTSSKVMDITGVSNLLTTYADWYGYIVVGSTDLSGSTTTSVDAAIKEGNNGGASTVEAWETAYEATKDHVDGYQLICSHIHQHLPTDYTQVYKYVADDVKNRFELMLYVEVPKPKKNSPEEGNENFSSEALVNNLKTLMGTVGYDKSIAYFGGGIKYYNDQGVLQDCDVLGTIIGLGDASATGYGPWYSFSGPNRGIVSSANGPVMENIGSPTKIDKLQSVAEWYGNVFVIKNTNTYGLRTMLWNGFTSHQRNDSYKFISIVRLNLYLKKNLRPILESYLEEPNIWDTWLQIYNNVRGLLDDLVYRRAISEYTWMGDQDATSYDDLQVNNEADVRQGKYHVILKYKDIVPLQEITMDIVIDAANSSVTVETTE